MKKRTRTKPSINAAKATAARRGGVCLSEKVTGARDKLLWKCGNGHQPWEAIYYSVVGKNQSWCPWCAGVTKLSIEVARQEAKKREGKCLSNRYVNGRAPLKWQCKSGHVWSQALQTIRAGHWCPKCAAPGAGQTIIDMRKLAKSRGGKCLSTTYKNARSKLQWQCHFKHSPWFATPGDVKSGRWCPECSGGIGERIVRCYFEYIFERKFPRKRPTFLRNPKTGMCLELDGYSKELSIAFEHHGRQHFTITSRFVKTAEHLSKRRNDDTLKKQLCEKHGIRLIEIPSVPDMLAISKLMPFLKRELKKNDIFVTKTVVEEEIDLKGAFVADNSEVFEKLKAVAKERGGRLLSRGYLGYHGKLRWQCRRGHAEWEASPAKILSGRWCPTCGGRQKKSLEEAQTLAGKFEGRCLSKNYVNSKSLLEWQCNRNHTWKASLDSVVQGHWCWKCYRIRLAQLQRDRTFSDVGEIAKKMGGECLSKSYDRHSQKLSFQCAEGHEWSAIPSSIKRGSWCKICGHERTKKALRKKSQ